MCAVKEILHSKPRPPCLNLWEFMGILKKTYTPSRDPRPENPKKNLQFNVVCCWLLVGCCWLSTTHAEAPCGGNYKKINICNITCTYMYLAQLVFLSRNDSEGFQAMICSSLITCDPTKSSPAGERGGAPRRRRHSRRLLRRAPPRGGAGGGAGAPQAVPMAGA